MPATTDASSFGTDPTLVPNNGTANTLIATGSAPAAALSARTTQARTTVLPAFDAGTVVHRHRDRYQTLEVLGRGGMGEVVLGRDHDIDREVALKYLHPERTEAAGLARFVEEIRTVGHLEHPNIVPIHDVGLDEQGRYFFVMKRLEGETLEQIIEKLRARDPAYEARYTFERRADIAIGILNALEFAHARGIVHRDVKPANVMVGHHGEVVLMDWGIAKMVGAKESVQELAGVPPGRVVETQAGALLGTPLYMSPEQADGRLEAIDARSDLYSVAVTIHELMGLRHYLDGKNELAEVLAGVKTLTTSNRPADYYAAGYPVPPAGYLHALTRCTQKDAALRFQSATEFSEALRRVRDGVCDVQCGLTLTRRGVGELGHWVDRHPRLTMFALPTATVLVLASLVVSALSVAHWLGH